MARVLCYGLALAATFRCLAKAQDSAPGGPTMPDTAWNCNAWHTVASGEGCGTVEAKYHITHEQFLGWNPSVSKDCLTNFWLGNAYCVGVDEKATKLPSSSSQTPTSSSSSSSSTQRTSGATSQPPITGTTSSVDATYSTRLPVTSWSITATTIETEFPPQRTQPGQPSDCIDWHYVEVGETCDSIAATCGSWDMTVKDFKEWNPSVLSDCSGLYYGWWVCVAVRPRTSGKKFEYITETTVSVPTKTADYTPTPFPAVDSIFEPSPTQADMPKNCQAWYQAKAGDTCSVIVSRGIITEKQFFEWNPALNSNCNGLWVNYYYCVAAYEAGEIFIPIPATVTSQPSPAASGIKSSCKAWYKATADDSCDSIVAIFAMFSFDEFVKWNPSVGSGCSKNTVVNFWYCVGIPGAPTTRPTLVALPTTVPKEIPTQDGMTKDCSQLWLVSSDDSCKSIVQANGITEEQFYEWNHAVTDGSDSKCLNLIPDVYVCVAVKDSSPHTSASTTPTSVSSTKTSQVPTSATSSTTTAPGHPSETPIPVQPGMVKGCIRFYSAESGDGCWAIANDAGIDLSDFYEWNPALNGDCSGLWVNYWYCIGIDNSQ